MTKKREDDVGRYVKETGYAFGKRPLKMPGGSERVQETIKLPKCAVLTCANEADPRCYARDVNDHPVMICDGHEPMPKSSEVAVRLPDPTAKDLADRIVRNGYSPTPAEVERVAHALLAEQEELSALRDLADLVRDADISALPPELLAVKQCWLAEESAEIEAAIAAQWDLAKRAGVASCRYCGFEAFPFADATIEDHMKACRPEVRRGAH